MLAENPKVIGKIFLKTEDHERGIYAIKLYQDGKPIEIIIDDFLLTLGDDFPSTMEAEAWVHFIEKARAKIYGTYLDSFNLRQTPLQIYRDLTGSKTECSKIKNITFETIQTAKNSKNIVALKPFDNKFVPAVYEYSIEETLIGQVDEPICKIRIPQWVKF